MSADIHPQSNWPEVPPDLQEEFDGWDRASAGTIDLVERLAEEAEVKPLVRIGLAAIHCNKKTL